MGTKIYCSLASPEEAERISELSLRTNRFNLSAQRYTTQDVLSFLSNDQYKVFYLSASDMFGDMGIVAAAIVFGCTILNFMQSCRVLERGFDIVLLKYIKSKINQELSGIYIETNKNKDYKSFYSKNGVTTLWTVIH